MLRSIIKRFFTPRVLKGKDVNGVAEPWGIASREDIAPFVLQANSVDSLRDYFRRLDLTWDVKVGKSFFPDSRVLVKINLNTADPYPASTCPRMLDALLVFLRNKGLCNIMVGDCSAISSVPTRKIAAKTGILDVVNTHKIPFVCFDEDKWREVRVQGKYLQKVILPEVLWQNDNLIYLANMKTHSVAGFSFGMKLAMGFVHPLDRYDFHRSGFLDEMIAELPLAVTPDITIIDGRQAFVTGGPAKGRIEQIDTILLSNHILAADLAAYGILFERKCSLGCMEDFQPDPFNMRQFRHAEAIGLHLREKIQPLSLT